VSAGPNVGVMQHEAKIVYTRRAHSSAAHSALTPIAVHDEPMVEMEVAVTVTQQVKATSRISISLRHRARSNQEVHTYFTSLDKHHANLRFMTEQCQVT